MDRKMYVSILCMAPFVFGVLDTSNPTRGLEKFLFCILTLPKSYWKPHTQRKCVGWAMGYSMLQCLDSSWGLGASQGHFSQGYTGKEMCSSFSAPIHTFSCLSSKSNSDISKKKNPLKETGEPVEKTHVTCGENMTYNPGSKLRIEPGTLLLHGPCL